MLFATLLLLSIAVLGWALFMYALKPRLGFSFVRTPLLTLSYFLLLSLVIAYLFLPVVGRLYAEPSLIAFIFLGVLLVGINPWVYRFAQNEHQARVRTSAAHPDGYPEALHPDLELFAIDSRFLLSKLGDVIFQQTVIGALILLLSTLPLPFFILSLLVASIFLLGHLGLVWRIPHRYASYFLVSAFFGGLFIPFLILAVPGGVYYAIGLHMLWYTMTGAFYWHGEYARKRARK